MSFEEIYRQNYKVVYGYLINLCKNAHLAEELTAQTFFKALNHYKTFDNKYKTSTWLCTIAKNEYLKYYNKHKSSKDQIELENIYDNKDIEEMFDHRETSMEIHRHLHILKEPYKEIFVLRVFAELSFADISEIFGKSESWARVTFYRAKNKLRERIDEDNEEKL